MYVGAFVTSVFPISPAGVAPENVALGKIESPLGEVYDEKTAPRLKIRPTSQNKTAARDINRPSAFWLKFELCTQTQKARRQVRK